MTNNKWKYVYDEEIWDHDGENFVGIISDGNRFLFYHILPDSNGQEMMYVFSSLVGLMTHDHIEVEFPWIGENELRFFSLLNELDEDSTDYCGENAIYRKMLQ